jgi:hypothetical protein
VGSFRAWGRGDEGILGTDEGETEDGDTEEGEGERGGKRFSWERGGKDDAAALRGVNGGNTAIELPPRGDAGNGGRAEGLKAGTDDPAFEAEEGVKGGSDKAAFGVRGGRDDPAWAEGVSGGRDDPALAEGVSGGREDAAFGEGVSGGSDDPALVVLEEGVSGGREDPALAVGEGVSGGSDDPAFVVLGEGVSGGSEDPTTVEAAREARESPSRGALLRKGKSATDSEEISGNLYVEAGSGDSGTDNFGRDEGVFWERSNIIDEGALDRIDEGDCDRIDEGALDLADEGAIDLADEGAIDLTDEGAIDLADEGALDLVDLTDLTDEDRRGEGLVLLRLNLGLSTTTSKAYFWFLFSLTYASNVSSSKRKIASRPWNILNIDIFLILEIFYF